MLRAGLIGLPATGKTTLFELMTRVHHAARSTHSRTDANVGISRVPDARLDRLAAVFNPPRKVTATVEVTDLAGPGRSDAAALLDVAPFRNADALLHVIRAFRDASVPPAAGSIDPARDAQLMEDELVLADLGVVERRLDRLERDLKKSPSAELRKERDVLIGCRMELEEGRPLRRHRLTGEDAKRLRGFQLLSAKPLLAVVNLDEADVARAGQAAEVAGLGAFLETAGAGVVAVCGKIELEIAQLDQADAASFLAEIGLRESGLDRVIRASYDLLGYISFFTINEDECRAWSVPRGTPAHVAAGEIHTDIARGFIRAEVTPYEALVTRGSFAACRQHGELRLEGRDYLVADGDVITFRFAT
jgi:GTP-binding protein YchF